MNIIAKLSTVALFLLWNTVAMAQGPGGGPPSGGRPPRGGRPPMPQKSMNLNQKNNVVTYSVSGVLEETNSKTKLIYANVGVLNTKDSTFVRGASSDENGNFIIVGVPSGDYYLRVSSLGYQSTYIPFKVPKDNVNLGTVSIKKEATTLNAVVIKDKKPIYSVDGEKNLYNVTEDPSIQLGTTADALQNAPGVEVDIEGNITLRGVSGVEIWINDKPSRLNEENLKTYIQQLPANALERIEVITNPSARYGIKTDAGVINIVTSSHIKRNSFTSFGLRGTSQPSISPWVSYMWANEKFSFNIYTGAWNSNTDRKSNGYSIAFDQNKDTASIQRYEDESKRKSLSPNLHISASYNIDSMNTLSFWGGMNISNSENSSFETRFREEMGNSYEYTTESSSKSMFTFGHYGLDYEHKFNNEGHRLSANISGGFSPDNTSSTLIRDYKDAVHKHLNLNRNYSSKGGGNNIGLGVDYSYPYAKGGELEVGITSDYRKDQSLTSTDTLVWGTTDIRNVDSLRFKDSENTSKELGGYITLRQKFGNFTVKAGLRADYELIDYVIFNAPEHNFNTDYFTLSPSLHLSYRTEDMHNFTLSYSRRINNPYASNLTTFITYNDDSYRTGNPDLEPYYTNSFEGGWTKYFENFGSVGISAYHRNVTNEVNTLTTAVYSDIYGRYVNYSKPVNLGSSYRTGAEFNITYRPTGLMNVRFYANIYDYYYEYLEGEELVPNRSLSYSLRVNLWIKLLDKFQVYASGRYRSPTQSLYAEDRATYNIDCGVRADFFKRKLSAHISVSDLFNWNKSENLINNPYYISYSSNQVINSRYISAGLTFRFGKLELEHRAKTGVMGGGM